jgi:SAM-dependent methyltransferase
MILDPTCSARSIWFDKDNPDVIRGDIRVVDLWVGKGENGRQWTVNPDVQMDYTAIPFCSNLFEMVVFDPPHLKDLGITSWLAQKYGKLFANWRDNIRSGFDECFRVLKPGGFLIFKWNEHQIPLVEILALAPYQPLFGHTTGSNTKTHWLCFVKAARP